MDTTLPDQNWYLLLIGIGKCNYSRASKLYARSPVQPPDLCSFFQNARVVEDDHLQTYFTVFFVVFLLYLLSTACLLSVQLLLCVSDSMTVSFVLRVGFALPLLFTEKYDEQMQGLLVDIVPTYLFYKFIRQFL